MAIYGQRGTITSMAIEPEVIAPIPIPPDLSDLPIIPELPRILHTISQNQATVLIGATGSGKTTQVGLYLLQKGLAEDKRIGVTQPRRLAATSVAKFVSELYGCELGQEVGYQIRFDDTTMEGTKLKFMTDGILLQEASVDPLFTKYSVLIFDEAHEQGLNTDIGLGLAKRALSQRPDLKVVIMSATIDTGRFSQYFDNAPVLTIEGRTFPITTHYLGPDEPQQALKMLHEEGEVPSLPALAAYKVQQIHMQQLLQESKDPKTKESKGLDTQGSKDLTSEVESLPPTFATQNSKLETYDPGHILVFMPGKKEIAQTIEYIEDLGHTDLLPLPAHSEMDQAEQQRIFEDTAKRKVVVATNIAETSITVPNLAYVVDSGLIRQMIFNHKYGIGALRTIEHSKAGLRQRQGRAGRTQPGVYLPLFTKREFDTGRPAYLDIGQTKRPDYSTPEIQREDLSGAVLRMSRLKISDLEEFDFMNAPSPGAVHNAIVALKVLGALDNQGVITPLGVQMATLPVEPRIGRMILAAEDFGCVEEILTICACLSTGTVFVRPIGEELSADAAKAKLEDKRGDLFTLLKIMPLYQKQKVSQREQWALQNYLNHHTLNEVLQIADQLQNLLQQLDIPITSLSQTSSAGDKANNWQKTQYQRIGRAITAGLLQNIAVKKGEHDYVRADGTTMRIHPGSVWADRRPDIIVYTEILEINGSTYAVNCQAVELDWIQELAPHLIQTEQQPLMHPWKGTQVGVYTITTLVGQEVGRKYSGKHLPQHMVDQGRRQEGGRQSHPHRHRDRKQRRRRDKRF
jgi:HrpA-like RNA helicase